MWEASGDDLIISATLKSCDTLLQKVLLLMQVLDTHGSVHSDPLKKYLSAGTSHWASDAVPCAYAACLHPLQCSVRCCAGALLWKRRHRGVKHLALRGRKSLGLEGGCSEGDSLAKLSSVSQLQKALLHCNRSIVLYIAFVWQVTAEDIGPDCPSSPSGTLAALSFLTDLARGLGRTPCTCTWLRSSGPGKWL